MTNMYRQNTVTPWQHTTISVTSHLTTNLFFFSFSLQLSLLVNRQSTYSGALSSSLCRAVTTSSLPSSPTLFLFACTCPKTSRLLRCTESPSFSYVSDLPTRYLPNATVCCHVAHPPLLMRTLGAPSADNHSPYRLESNAALSDQVSIPLHVYTTANKTCLERAKRTRS